MRALASIRLRLIRFPAGLHEIETALDLAQQRMVDLTTLPALGHYLPAIYMADSAFNATISSNRLGRSLRSTDVECDPFGCDTPWARFAAPSMLRALAIAKF